MKDVYVCYRCEAWPEDIQALLQEFAGNLSDLGYHRSTIRLYIRVARHFIGWRLQESGYPLRAGPKIVWDFLHNHLKKCRYAMRTRDNARAALRHFVVHLKKAGFYSVPRVTSPSALEQELAVFDAYLRDTRGLSESTRSSRRRYLRFFLRETFGPKAKRLGKLTPECIMQFVARQAKRRSLARNLRSIFISLRSYLRFRQLREGTDESLSALIPPLRQWRLAALPKVLSEEQLARLLYSFDRSNARGRRDYAIERCFIDLGLRAMEVANLGLDDIDWRNATLRLVGSKPRRDDLLPLPASVARAISDYLRNGRPETASRAVFVSHQGPVGKPLNVFTVRGIIRKAAKRSGLPVHLGGVRVLRQTAATRLLRAGSTLKEVADILRHRRLDTTTIYTKVDLSQLAAVAMPWPEASHV